MPVVGLDLIEIENYKATISRPIYQDGRLILSDDQFDEVKNLNFGKYIIF